jgi:hypothetical protein
MWGVAFPLYMYILCELLTQEVKAQESNDGLAFVDK